MARDYLQTSSLVIVTFSDGEIKEYIISASPSIGGYLANQAGETGILQLFNLDESYAIPMNNIREWKIVNRPALDEAPLVPGEPS